MKSVSTETFLKGKIINLFFFSLFLPVLFWVTQSCPILWDPTDCSPPESSIHGIPRQRKLEWVVMPSFRESSQPRDRTEVSHIAGGFFTIWAALFFSLSFSVYLPLPFPKSSSLAQSARKSIRWETRMPWVCTLLNHQPNSGPFLCHELDNCLLIKKYIYIYLFIWLHLVLDAACRIFPFGMWTLSCSMWDLVPWPGIEPRPPALETWSLSHWTPKEVLCLIILKR